LQVLLIPTQNDESWEEDICKSFLLEKLDWKAAQFDYYWSFSFDHNFHACFIMENEVANQKNRFVEKLLYFFVLVLKNLAIL